MKLHAKMTPQEWKDLLNYLMGEGVLITYIPTTDDDGLFVDFKYAIVEYKGEFYALHSDINYFEPFTVTRYSKLSPYEKRQNDFPKEVGNTDELIAYMNTEHNQVPVKNTFNQWIFHELRGVQNRHTRLWRLENELAGWREKNILSTLTSVSMRMHTKDYCVLRFYGIDGDYFDYEVKSHRITN